VKEDMPKKRTHLIVPFRRSLSANDMFKVRLISRSVSFRKLRHIKVRNNWRLLAYIESLSKLFQDEIYNSIQSSSYPNMPRGSEFNVYVSTLIKAIWQQSLTNLFFLVTSKSVNVFFDNSYYELDERIYCQPVGIPFIRLDNFKEPAWKFSNYDTTEIYIPENMKLTKVLSYLAQYVHGSDNYLNYRPGKNHYHINVCLLNTAPWSSAAFKSDWMSKNSGFVSCLETLGYKVSVITYKELSAYESFAEAMVVYLNNISSHSIFRNNLYTKIINLVENRFNLAPPASTSLDSKMEAVVDLGDISDIAPAINAVNYTLKDADDEIQVSNLARFYFLVAKGIYPQQFFTRRRSMVAARVEEVSHDDLSKAEVIPHPLR
jgi:hypothetical protein